MEGFSLEWFLIFFKNKVELEGRRRIFILFGYYINSYCVNIRIGYSWEGRSRQMFFGENIRCGVYV